MITPKTLTIDDRHYRLIPMQPLNGLPFALKVAANLGSGIAGLDAGGFSLSELSTEPDTQGLEKALAGVILAAAHIDPDKVHQLMREALNHEVYASDRKLSDELYFNNWFDEHPGD